MDKDTVTLEVPRELLLPLLGLLREFADILEAAQKAEVEAPDPDDVPIEQAEAERMPEDAAPVETPSDSVKRCRSCVAFDGLDFCGTKQKKVNQNDEACPDYDE